jgi:hypothetical protein
MIKITHIKYSNRSIGIAASKKKSGPNKIQITAEDKNGTMLYPEPFRLDREIAIAKYGIQEINKGGLMGVFVPLRDIEEGTANEVITQGNTTAEEEQPKDIQSEGQDIEPSEPGLF